MLQTGVLYNIFFQDAHIRGLCNKAQFGLYHPYSNCNWPEGSNTYQKQIMLSGVQILMFKTTRYPLGDLLVQKISVSLSVIYLTFLNQTFFISKFKHWYFPS